MGVYGGNLKFKERITGRFADVLIWMYMITSTLRRFEAEVEEGTSSDVRVFCAIRLLSNSRSNGRYLV